MDLSWGEAFARGAGAVAAAAALFALASLRFGRQIKRRGEGDDAEHTGLD